jgi:hypothetical protein
MPDHYRLLGVSGEARDHARRGEEDGRRTRARQAAPPDWFADEIVRGFPSVHGVVDRLRDAFFGDEEATAPLSAEILLEAREAFLGLIVPLDVPMRRTCMACGGRGESWMEPCAACEGSGEARVRHSVRVLVPPGVRHGDRFRFSITSPYAPATVVELKIAIR